LVKREGREEAGATVFTRRRRVGWLRGEEEENEGGEGETDKWGPGVSESKEKEKEREGVGRRGERLAGCWAAWAVR
jgi:hypothetical protein